MTSQKSSGQEQRLESHSPLSVWLTTGWCAGLGPKNCGNVCLCFCVHAHMQKKKKKKMQNGRGKMVMVAMSQLIENENRAPVHVQFWIK